MFQNPLLTTTDVNGTVHNFKALWFSNPGPHENDFCLLKKGYPCKTGKFLNVCGSLQVQVGNFEWNVT